MSKRRVFTILFYLWSLAIIAVDIAGAVIAYPSRLWWLALLIIPIPIFYVVKTIRLFGFLPR